MILGRNKPRFEREYLYSVHEPARNDNFVTAKKKMVCWVHPHIVSSSKRRHTKQNNEMPRSLLEPFVNSLRVVDCSRQRVGHDYCRIDAVVEAVTTSAAAMPIGSGGSGGGGSNVRLTFRYVRQPRKDTTIGDGGNDRNVFCSVLCASSTARGRGRKKELNVPGRERK